MREGVPLAKTTGLVRPGNFLGCCAGMPGGCAANYFDGGLFEHFRLTGPGDLIPTWRRDILYSNNTVRTVPPRFWRSSIHHYGLVTDEPVHLIELLPEVEDLTLDLCFCPCHSVDRRGPRGALVSASRLHDDPGPVPACMVWPAALVIFPLCGCRNIHLQKRNHARQLFDGSVMAFIVNHQWRRLRARPFAKLAVRLKPESENDLHGQMVQHKLTAIEWPVPLFIRQRLASI